MDIRLADMSNFESCYTCDHMGCQYENAYCECKLNNRSGHWLYVCDDYKRCHKE